MSQLRASSKVRSIKQHKETTNKHRPTIETASRSSSNQYRRSRNALCREKAALQTSHHSSSIDHVVTRPKAPYIFVLRYLGATCTLSGSSAPSMVSMIFIFCTFASTTRAIR